MLELLEEIGRQAIDLELLKESLGLHDAVRYDSLLNHIIKSATSRVEEYTQRTIVDKKWAYSHTHSVLYLPRPLIRQIESVSSNGIELDKSEYRKGFTRDTTVIILNAKYADSENKVVYRAGYGENIPDVLKNVIFDCAKTLFHQGIGVNTDVEHYISDTLGKSSFSNKVYCNELIRGEQKRHPVQLALG